MSGVSRTSLKYRRLKMRSVLKIYPVPVQFKADDEAKSNGVFSSKTNTSLKKELVAWERQWFWDSLASSIFRTPTL